MYSNNQFDDQEEEYFGSSSFIVRILNIIILFAAWVCAAAALDHGSNADGDLQSTRVAFLIFALIAFIECIIILIASLSGYVIEVLYIIIDSIMLLIMLVMSIVAAVKEVQVANGSISNSQYRYGSLAAAAVFGFISVVLFLELIIFYIRSIIYEDID